ncbi:5-oxoprolinase [Acrocarpospora pleiomorpha]|uniref:5-oxoprolinase n=1 Tax=Acrocarpospora pleiomorpha TaxID=90975 RepID=A0A5M3XTY4_9ACTN|nr:hydantoinase/oxoprolinase family protein [Acrocarpospora pleiomorpha]GES24707.1 5-oxoprolinase [Acrocarpospora pleiomorpha]
MRVATDIGGTFTDLAYVGADRVLRVDKVSSTPGEFEVAVDQVLDQAGICPEDNVESFIHGSTVVINALIERKGGPTALITTAGFRDVLEIGRSNRPDAYNYRYRKPRPFVERHLRFEVRERLARDGQELTPLDVAECEMAAIAAKAAGAQAIAICFLHAYANPVHEIACAEAVKQVYPEAFVTMSHETTREWREYERTSTAVLNAYVQEVAATYLERLEKRLVARGIDRSLQVMQSNGGTVSFRHARELPIKLVESGPVAGVAAAAAMGLAAGRENIISLDIGGTTAKSSLIERGEVRLTTDYRIDRTPRSPGYPIKSPVVDIVEIGAGGGSIAWTDELGRLGLGPQSAGARPGPACYPNGGTLPTVTDANLVAGRINPALFLGGRLAVSVDRARAAIATVARPLGLEVEEAALGIIRLADAKMLNAIKLVSVRRGYDPRDFHLMAFGGGGPVHGAALGAELRTRSIVIPPAAGMFSAVGMLMTRLRADWVQTKVLPAVPDSGEVVTEVWRDLQTEALAHFDAEGIDPAEVTFTHALDLRYLGQEHTVTVRVTPAASIPEIISVFGEQHEQEFTFQLAAPVEIVDFHLTALHIGPPPFHLSALPSATSADEALKGERPVLFERTGHVSVPTYDRALLGVGVALDGPAIIEEASSSTVVGPQQRAAVDEQGSIVITQKVATKEQEVLS